MDPKAKIGLWLFREVGGGFSELYLTLQVRTSIEISLFYFHHRWEWCCLSFRRAQNGQEILPLLWDSSDAPPLLLPASDCS